MVRKLIRLYFNNYSYSERVFKIGEATFSEVFKFELKDGSNHVVKIIPLDLENNSPIDQYPLPININAAIHECKVLQEISSLNTSDNWTGFTKVLEICVIQGKYPVKLQNEWRHWLDTKGSENSDPGKLCYHFRN